MDNTRTRTFSWSDPRPTGAAAGTMSGLAFFQQLVAGELAPPPVLDALGMRLESVAAGKVVFAMEPAEYHYNPIGVVHGGVIATLLDSAVGCAVHTMLPAGVAYTTLELKVNYIRAARVETGLVRAEGTAVHVGRQSAVAEGRVTDGAGKLIATCSTTCILFPLRSDA